MKIAVLFLMLVIISGMSLIGINQAFAFNCLSNVAGTWSDTSTWTNCDDGIPDDTGDNANIQINGDVQLNNDFVVGTVSVIEGGSLSVNAKLRAQIIDVGNTGNLFINCNGELTLTEGGSNDGLLINHGILETLLNILFSNVGGTYQSSGTDIFGDSFSGNDIERIASICGVIGGTVMPIDTTAMLLAGVQTNAAWMIPVIVSAVGIGLFVVSRKSE